jgi:hypothetical protein
VLRKERLAARSRVIVHKVRSAHGARFTCCGRDVPLEHGEKALQRVGWERVTCKRCLKHKGRVP